MEQGLAESMGRQGSADAMVQEVVQLLMQGMDPQELVERGVPMEVVQQAVEIVLAQENQAMNTQAEPSTEPGLAMTAGRM